MSGEPILPLAEDPGLRTRPLVFVGDLAAPELDDGDRHHLERVLRLAPGDLVTVADGHGNWRPCRLGSTLEPMGEVRHQPPPGPPLTVAFTPVKAVRPEWVVQKLTEVGVDRIVPVLTERSVVRWDDERWRRRIGPKLATTVTEACAQSRRLHRPTVEAPRSLTHFLAASGPVASGPVGSGPVAPDLSGATDGCRVVLADPGGGPLPAGITTIVVGPEGGFSPAERRLALTAGLPGAVLRAETAAVVAGAVLVGLRAGQLAAPATFPFRPGRGQVSP